MREPCGPMVCPGSPPRGHTPPAVPDRACLRDRLVHLAPSPSGDGASLTSQTKGATVVLVRVSAKYIVSRFSRSASERIWVARLAPSLKGSDKHPTVRKRTSAPRTALSTAHWLNRRVTVGPL